MITRSRRQLQLGETIKRAMSEIFLRKDILTIPGNYITVLEADVSPDAKSAHIFINIFGNEKTHNKIVAELNKAASHFRTQIAKKVNLRFIPEITFALDQTQSKALKMDRLIENEARKIASTNNTRFDD